VLKLLDKLSEAYSFIAQNEMRGKISSMYAIPGKISQQVRECARFIKNYSETKKSCESCHATAPSRASTIITGSRLGKNVVWETEDTIEKHNGVFDKLVQNFRDQVTHDVVIHVHRTGKGLDILVTSHIFTRFQKKYWTSAV
jgi:hypothetical protein